MPEDVTGFWFSPEVKPHWFKPDPELDRRIEATFAPLIEQAAAGSFDDWLRDAQGLLALCLLLDQFPRNIWRGTPRAYAYDGEARRVAAVGIERGLDRLLEPEQRLFIYLPFEHSEDLADQERSVRLMRTLGDPDWDYYAERHREIIARFGRFPHRNVILGRPSTPEELAFLKEPNSSF